MPNDFHQRRKNLSEAYHLALQGLLRDEQLASGATATPAALAEQLTADPSATLPFLTFDLLLARRHLKHYQQRVNELEGEIEQKMGFGATVEELKGDKLCVSGSGATVQYDPANAPALPEARTQISTASEAPAGHCAYGGMPSDAEIAQCRALRSFNCECYDECRVKVNGVWYNRSGSGATEAANPPELQPSTPGDLHSCAAQCGNIDAATLASIADLKARGL